MTSKTTPSSANRAGRRRKKGQKSLWAWLMGVLAIAIVVPAFLLGSMYVAADVPEPNEIVNKQISLIMASDSSTELARVVPPEGNRSHVELDKIPDPVINAVLAAEDREFYTNRGYSITGFARAALGQLRGDDSAGGGSTITQQYVKNTVVGNEHSIKRKIHELIYSAKMTKEWSKEDILEAYLNTIYFGRNSYGVAAAAKGYFGKDISELGPAEAAVLAASIQRPSQLDPWNNREAAEERWNYVLDGMVTTGTLSQAERDTLVYPETSDPAFNRAYTEATGTNGLIKNQVMWELAELGITEEDVETRGLRVTTTIDPVVQQNIVDSVHNLMQGEDEAIRTASVTIDHNTGAVRGYYGGEEASGWDYANAGVQTGSTFKIFGFAAAMQQGISPNAYYSSAPVKTGNIEVGNAFDKSCGSCSISQALKESFNTSFIRLQKDLENGPQDTADMAHALGVARSIPGIEKTLTENGQTPYEGIILGQYQSRPFDMAVALGTLANEGIWHKPHFVEKVETADGEVLYQYEGDQGERRVSKVAADNTIKAMGPIAAWSNGALAGGRPSAAKTGTAQLGDTGYNKDAWMIGATPQLSTAVWVGTVDNTPLLNTWGGNMYGAGLPTQIWKSVMDKSLQNQDFEYFPEAEAIVSDPKKYYTNQAPVPVAPRAPAASRAPAEPSKPAEQVAPVEEAPAAPAPQAPAPAPAPQLPPPPNINDLLNGLLNP
ncbi:transglycosylase domain-containing protein [Corynebacterium kalinowskii]|uniref:transglycosylase domain-containing protein n=1 Tax=Corynebacterium kalinowskii TaxID=2675216 RepID=UPI001E3F28F4|nr:transglycosylase domain-containing protein [Corynebacterium kalinowskii]